jgi:hypothetical protein
MRAAIRIILEPFYNTGYTVLVALEIDNPVTLLVTTTLVTNRDAAIVVAPACPGFLVQQRAVRFAFVLSVGLDRYLKPASGGGRF